MNEAQELLRSLLRSSNHETRDELTWSELDSLEKRTCLASSSFDIDFCAFSGLANDILNDKGISGWLSNLLGTFVKNPYIQSLNGYKYSRVLVICEIKPFKLALTLNENSNDDEPDLIEEEQKEKKIHQQQSNFIKNVSDLLGAEKGRTVAFRDIKATLCTIFLGFELICFQFGQKQEIENFLTHAEKIDDKVKISIALGMEVFLDNNILMAAPENIPVGECFYPMLLSRRAGSILCSSKHSLKFAERSRR